MYFVLKGTVGLRCILARDKRVKSLKCEVCLIRHMNSTGQVNINMSTVESLCKKKKPNKTVSLTQNMLWNPDVCLVIEMGC